MSRKPRKEGDGGTMWSTKCHTAQMSSQKRAEGFIEIGGLTPLLNSITGVGL